MEKSRTWKGHIRDVVIEEANLRRERESMFGRFFKSVGCFQPQGGQAWAVPKYVKQCALCLTAPEAIWRECRVKGVNLRRGKVPSGEQFHWGFSERDCSITFPKISRHGEPGVKGKGDIQFGLPLKHRVGLFRDGVGIKVVV